MNNTILKKEYDFSGLIFNDYVTPSELSDMEKEVIKDCFDNASNYLPHMRNTAVYKAILKHCSNLDIDKYAELTNRKLLTPDQLNYDSDFEKIEIGRLFL